MVFQRIGVRISSVFDGKGMKAAQQQMGTLQSVAKTSTLSMSEVSDAVSESNDLFFDQNGALRSASGNLNTLSDEVQAVEQSYQQGQAAGMRFRFELLSLMFAGMALQKAMFGLLRPAFKAAGVFELVGSILEFMFMPTALDVVDILTQEVMPAVFGMGEETRSMAGKVVLALGILGSLLKIGGMVGLAWDGVAAIIGTNASMFGALANAARFAGTKLGLIAGGSGAATSLTSVLGVLGSTVAWVAALVAAFAVAYKTNFLGIRDITNSTVGTIIDVFGRLLSVLEDIWDYLSKKLPAAWNKLPEPVRNAIFPEAETGIGETRSALRSPSAAADTNLAANAAAAPFGMQTTINLVGTVADTIGMSERKHIERGVRDGVNSAMGSGGGS